MSESDSNENIGFDKYSFDVIYMEATTLEIELRVINGSVNSIHHK